MSYLYPNKYLGFCLYVFGKTKKYVGHGLLVKGDLSLSFIKTFLVSYCCCNNYYKPSGLKQLTFIIL